MSINAIEVAAHYGEILATKGQEAADHYFSSVAAIVRIEQKPSAALVDAALHMANVETFNAMERL